MEECSKFIRKARIDQATQLVCCPACDKSNFTVFRKELLAENKIYLHFAKCEECGVSFIYKVNPKGEPFVD